MPFRNVSRILLFFLALVLCHICEMMRIFLIMKFFRFRKMLQIFRDQQIINLPYYFSIIRKNKFGVVEKAWIQNNKLYVTCRFSNNDFAQEILVDVKDGIRRNVSIGYIINDTKLQKQVNDFPIVNVTNWTPYEISIVSVPADHTVRN